MFGFHLNMKIAFKGINNIYINQGIRQNVPFVVPTVKGDLFKTTADIEQINFKCTLNDEGKKNLNDYYIALAKYNDGRKFISKADSFDSLDLLYSDVDVHIGESKQNFKSLRLNGEELDIDNDSLLPLYSFLALVTKNISNIENINPTAKAWFEKLNSGIHKKACDYLGIKV